MSASGGLDNYVSARGVGRAGHLGMQPRQLTYYIQLLETILDAKATAVATAAAAAGRVAPWLANPSHNRGLADLPRVTVCETGFNAGHSAAAFLTVSDRVDYVGFDLGTEYSAAKPCFQRLVGSFGAARMKVTWGDSITTVPRYLRENPALRCDLAVVDGGHAYRPALSDLKNFARVMSPQGWVLVDDCASVNAETMMKAWNEVAGGTAGGIGGGARLYREHEKCEMWSPATPQHLRRASPGWCVGRPLRLI